MAAKVRSGKKRPSGVRTLGPGIADLLVVHGWRHRPAPAAPACSKPGKVWNGRCWACAILGDLQLVSVIATAAFAAAERCCDFRLPRGLIYLKMGRFDSAIEDYSSRCA